MIRHIFKIIWNERKANAWIVLEFLVVFSILWFCTDYMFFSGKLLFESQGYNADHVYKLNMEDNPDAQPADEDTRYEIAMALLDRIRQYPGVEAASMSKAAIPYPSWGYNQSFQINEDTLYYGMSYRMADPEFFEVFKIEFIKGKSFQFDPSGAVKEVVISPHRDGKFGSYPDGKFPVNDVRTIHYNDEEYIVTGVIEKMKNYHTDPFKSNVFAPIPKNQINVTDGTNITFRVSAAADKDFAEKFNKEMEQVLSISPYTFQSVTPVQDSIDSGIDWFVNKNLRSVIAVSIFLIANIFLGIIGTFWSRIQSRRSEIGLRIALGSSKRKVKLMLFTETALMLFLISIPATYICLNLGQTELLNTFGIPTSDRAMIGSGIEQNFINYAATFLLLIIVSGIAVWYPAKLSTNMPPAEALREE